MGMWSRGGMKHMRIHPRSMCSTISIMGNSALSSTGMTLSPRMSLLFTLTCLHQHGIGRRIHGLPTLQVLQRLGAQACQQRGWGRQRRVSQQRG